MIDDFIALFRWPVGANVIVVKQTNEVKRTDVQIVSPSASQSLS